ncbi:hypothetical protein CFC21_015889 [Triticum aestivum]|uniref:Uncharacterized protein n=3 Tax=Triticum TaxID=4564 RepID=A0A9R1NMA2_TRITD|nr:hypothetical protein CFC21_015889 [Triticum aestivum]VAH27641.1 unnamed protein product [Triticum turgidum subsp. durum]
MGLDVPPRCRYQRLSAEQGGDGERPAAASATRWTRARRPLRLRRRARKKVAPRPGGGRRLRLMRVVLALLPARRAAALLAELVGRIACAAECPAIVFSSQWGLPALSHSASGGASRTARLRAFYLERSRSAGTGSLPVHQQH